MGKKSAIKSKEIEKILEPFFVTREEYQGCKIDLIKSGYNRSIYLLTSKNGNKYIAKKGNGSKDIGATNLNDVKIQKFLLEEGCAFVPQVFFWDESNDIYIEEYIDGDNVAFNSLDDTDFDTIAKQLVKVHKIPVKNYFTYLDKHGFKKEKISTPADSLKIFGFDRYEIVKTSCPDKYVVGWLDERLQESVRETHKHTASPEDAHMKWGDIGENLCKKGRKIYFLDWEFAELGFGSELAYIKSHSHLNLANFKHLVSRYSVYSGISEDVLYEEIFSSEKITRTNDVVWAAMKWGQSNTEEEKLQYRELTYERIKLAENITR